MSSRKPPSPPRRRVIRSSWMWGLLAAIGLGLVAWILMTTRTGDPADPAEPAPSPTAAAAQRTMLIQVRNDADLGADNLIAGVGADLPPAQLLVASRLIVDVPDTGQQTLGQSARMLDRSASQDALSDLLALRIDGTLSLGRLALAGMVDFVGGITVDVDQPITGTDPASGVQKVVIPAGTQTLDGTQAAAYALVWLPDEPETARMARYSQVMTATISRLPDDSLRIESMLTSLGGSARTTAPTANVAEFLLALRGAILVGGQQVQVLPTTDMQAGEELSIVRVDLDAADAATSALFGPSVLTGVDAKTRVLVRNGVGAPGLGTAARDRLVAAGLVYINGGNADEFGQVSTEVSVADSTLAARARGEQVVKALRLPDTVVQVADTGQSAADVDVVLGADFEP